MTRISRQLTSFAGLLAIGGIVVMAPTAARGDASVVSRIGLPSPLVLTATAPTCTNNTSPVATVVHVKSAATPPLGTGDLELAVAPNSTGTLSNPLPGLTQNQLTTFSLETYQPASAPASNTAEIVVGQGSGGNTYVLSDTLPATTAWSTANLMTDTLDWYLVDVDGEHGPPSDSGTYAQFMTAHPVGPDGVGDLVGVDVVSENCGGNNTEDLDIDDLQLGTTADSAGVTTYDFEAPLPATLTAKESTKDIVDGSSFTPSVSLTTKGQPLADETVSLYDKKSGSSYHKVLTATTSKKGIATGAKQHPTASTTYEWRWPGDDTSYAPITTKPAVEKVASEITLSLATTRVKKGEQVEGEGDVAPTHTGAKVTLRRISGHKETTIGTGKASHNGSYDIHGVVPKGNWQIVATTAATATNAAGTSAPRHLSVK